MAKVNLQSGEKVEGKRTPRKVCVRKHTKENRTSHDLLLLLTPPRAANGVKVKRAGREKPVGGANKTANSHSTEGDAATARPKVH